MKNGPGTIAPQEAPDASTAASRPARFTALRFQRTAVASPRVDIGTRKHRLSRFEKGTSVHLWRRRSGCGSSFRHHRTWRIVLKKSDFRNCEFLARWRRNPRTVASCLLSALGSFWIGLARNWPTPQPKFPDAFVRQKTLRKSTRIRVFQHNRRIADFGGKRQQ
jgi:hypothetical protein